MERIASLAELRRAETSAVIINCGTKWFTTLALASVFANTRLPVVVIDCESRDGSEEHFASLAAQRGWRFSWLRWPLRPHGLALDHLFLEIPAENVLLVDSDVELRSCTMIDEMERLLSTDERAYGAGLLHAARWMGSDEGLPEGMGYYCERMWIPLVLLRTSAVRAALHRSRSFAADRIYRDGVRSRGWSRVATSLHRVAGVRALATRRSVRAEGDRGSRAAFLEYDTGARLHEWLLAEGLSFAALPPVYWQAVHHYHGITRSTLAGWSRKLAQRLRLISSATETTQSQALDHVRARLAAHYGIEAHSAA